MTEIGKKTCPLGEDCDLTVAWMAGKEDQRKHMRRRMAEAADRIEALEAAMAKADELARAALECHPYVEELRCGDDLRAALTAYREARK